MPLVLFAVTSAAIFWSDKTAKKLKAAFEEREFGVRDVIMLIIAIVVIVSVIIFIPHIAVMTVFLFAYSMLLFLFTYIFSDFHKARAQLFCVLFLIISLTAASISLLISASNVIFIYGGSAFLCLFGLAFAGLVYEEKRGGSNERWYLAVLPPAVFVILYVFFSGTSIWYPFLLDLYGGVFAVLIILYLGSLFTWRTSMIFVSLLTAVDIFLVFVTGSMVSAAKHVSVLRLPVLITLPTFPVIAAEGGALFMSLGLGDFFFAGLIAVQTLNRYGKTPAFLSAIAMSLSFFIFEMLILNLKLKVFPGTLMIICGWLVFMSFKAVKSKLTSPPLK
ncbi:MAG: hypothetical protein QXN87_00390 [Candidatus Bathyarchaeia archaeon]